MLTESAPYLSVIFENMDKLLLIFARIASFLFLMPIFSGVNVPTRIKIGFSFIIAVVIFSTGVTNGVEVSTTAVGYAFSLCKEIFTGILLGYIVFTFFTVFYFAGQMMDYSIGYSMVNVMDPVSQIQVPITGNLIYYVMAVLLIVSGGLNSILLVFFDSFNSIPLGTTNFMMDEGFVYFMIQLTSTYLELGIRIAAPLLGTILIVDIALGILVKASPQMNVFVVGLPIKLLVGLTLLVLICPYFLQVYNEVFNLMYESLSGIIGGMSYN